VTITQIPRDVTCMMTTSSLTATATLKTDECFQV